MSKTIINPGTLPKPSGFSHGILSEGGRMLFIAGQPGTDASGQVAAPGDWVAQFQQAIANLKAVVEAAGGAVTDIVQMTIYVTDVEAYRARLKAIGEVYRPLFGRYYPAVTLVGVRELFDKDALLEIQAIAVIER